MKDRTTLINSLNVTAVPLERIDTFCFKNNEFPFNLMFVSLMIANVLEIEMKHVLSVRDYCSREQWRRQNFHEDRKDWEEGV